MKEEKFICRMLKIYDNLEEIILVIMFAIMILTITLQVIMRYVFNNSLLWPEELARFLFVWVSWFGVSTGEKKGEHIKITMLLDKMPFKTAHVINIISDLIVIIVCVITIKYGVFLTNFLANTEYTTINVSYAWGYAAIPLGCTLMILRLLPSTYKSAKCAVKGNSASYGNEGGMA